MRGSFIPITRAKRLPPDNNRMNRSGEYRGFQSQAFRRHSVMLDVISLKPVPGDRMIQLVRRFILGFCIGAAFSLVLFFVTRTFFYSTIQTPESEAHYEVLYAGFRSEVALALVGLGPLLSGLASVALVKRTVNGLAFFTSTLASLLMSYGLMKQKVSGAFMAV